MILHSLNWSQITQMQPTAGLELATFLSQPLSTDSQMCNCCTWPLCFLSLPLSPPFPSSLLPSSFSPSQKSVFLPLSFFPFCIFLSLHSILSVFILPLHGQGFSVWQSCQVRSLSVDASTIFRYAAMPLQCWMQTTNVAFTVCFI